MTSVPATGSRRRAVVFDLDDTLYPERQFALSGFRAAALAVASTFECNAHRVLRVLVGTYRRGHRAEVFQQACASESLPSEAVALMLAAYRAHAPTLTLPRASRDVLLACGQLGATAILTNGDPQVQRGKVAALGLESLVDEVVYAAEHHPDGKPALQVFRHVEATLHVDEGSCVMVGDNFDKDIVGAVAAGWRCVWKRPLRATTYGDVPDRVSVVTRLAEVPRVAEKILQEGFVGYEHAHRTTTRRRE